MIFIKFNNDLNGVTKKLYHNKIYADSVMSSYVNCGVVSPQEVKCLKYDDINYMNYEGYDANPPFVERLKRTFVYVRENRTLYEMVLTADWAFFTLARVTDIDPPVQGEMIRFSHDGRSREIRTEWKKEYNRESAGNNRRNMSWGLLDLFPHRHSRIFIPYVFKNRADNEVKMFNIQNRTPQQTLG